MPVSDVLQNMVADLSASIAGKRQLTRSDQEVLRRNLKAAIEEQRRDERRSATARLAADELAAGIERGVADLAGLAARARQQMEARS